MDDITFWTLIDRTRKASGNDGNIQADLLTTELTRLSEDEIISFHNIFEEQMDRAYSRDLWAAAYIINCGCSEDGFMDFRAWLIGQGLEIFEGALNNPEILVDVVKPDTDTQIQQLMNVANDAYLAKKSESMTSFRQELPNLTGNEWDESMLSHKYPKLHAQFGDCEDWRETFLK